MITGTAERASPGRSVIVPKSASRARAVATGWRGVFVPLALWMVYSPLTVAAYAFGPYLFPRADSALLWGYLAIVHVAAVAGYWFGVRRHHPGRPIASDPDRLVLWLGVVALGGMAVAVLGDLRSGLSVLGGLQDPGQSRQIWIEERGGTPTMYLALLLSVANIPLLSTTASFWSRLRPSRRILGVAVAAGMCLTAIAGGSRQAMFAVLSVGFISAVAGKLAGTVRVSFKVLAGVFLAGVVAFLLYSSFIASSRLYQPTEDYSEFLRMQREYPIQPDHWALDLVPKSIEAGFLSAFYYYGHGYEGLAICLEQPIDRIAFGFGHSSVLMRVLERLAGERDIRELSYFERIIEDERYSPSLWITIYPWIASDVTFPGSVIAIFLLAMLLALAWRDVVVSRNPFAAWALGWLFYTVAMIPIIFPPGDYGAFLSYWGSVAIWLIARSGWRLRREVR